MRKEDAAAAAAPLPPGLTELCPNASNFLPVDFQPLQESLVRLRVAGLKDLVPLVHFRLVQADLLEHGDPFSYAYMFFHISLVLVISMTGRNLNCEVIDGSSSSEFLPMSIARNLRRPRGFLALALNLALDPAITFSCGLPRCAVSRTFSLLPFADVPSQELASSDRAREAAAWRQRR
jgi:hypothetical protein